MLSKVLLVAVGGACGAVLRWWVSETLTAAVSSGFPYGTLAVNLIGCFVIGGVWGYTLHWPETPAWTPFVVTGVLGAFTTFSTFSKEAFALYENGQVGMAVTYVGVSTIVGFALVGVGYGLGQLLVK